MAERTLKAYQVTEPDEGHCCIVFATSSAAARRQGAAEMDITFSEVESCTRAAWADGYAPGPVPPKAKIGAGWWYECACGCGRRIDGEDGIDLDDTGEDDAEANPMAPVYQGERVYWNQSCVDEEAAELKRRAEAKARDQSEAEAAVLAQFPFATGIVSYRGHRNGKYNQLGASFHFPGGKFAAHWQLGAATIDVSACDQDAWKAATSASALESTNG